MSLREHFAALAMQGMRLPLTDKFNNLATKCAESAVLYADALLAALEKKD